MKNKKAVIVVVLMLAVILIDQISKIYAINNLGENGKVVIEGVLNFDYVENTGVAFGMGSDDTLKIVIINLVALAIIAKFMWTQRSRIGNVTMVFLSFALAGGVSNLIDRIFRGYVVDFINLIPKIYFPKFNVADICIVTAWVVLAFVFAVDTYKEIKAVRRLKARQLKESKE